MVLVTTNKTWIAKMPETKNWTEAEPQLLVNRYMHKCAMIPKLNLVILVGGITVQNYTASLVQPEQSTEILQFISNSQPTFGK